MSSAKAALESDTRVSFNLFPNLTISHIDFLVARFSPSLGVKIMSYFMPFQVLAFEAGRKRKIRVNTISAGTLCLFFFLSRVVNKFG